MVSYLITFIMNVENSDVKIIATQTEFWYLEVLSNGYKRTIKHLRVPIKEIYLLANN